MHYISKHKIDSLKNLIYDILLPEVLQSWCTIIIYVGEIEKPGRGFRSLMMEKRKKKKRSFLVYYDGSLPPGFKTQ